jgi:hypothetical protein
VVGGACGPNQIPDFSKMHKNPQDAAIFGPIFLE